MFQLLVSLLMALGMSSWQGLGGPDPEGQTYGDLYAEAFYYCSGSSGTPVWELERFKPWEDSLKPQPPHEKPDKAYSMAVPDIVPELEMQLETCTHLYIEEPAFREAVRLFHQAWEQQLSCRCCSPVMPAVYSGGSGIESGRPLDHQAMHVLPLADRN